MSQESCLDCYKKHIATAMVFEDEANIGNDYPLHKWLAVGELHAAEKEVVRDFPLLAQITREHRIKYEDDNSPVPTLQLIEMSISLESTEESDDEDSNDPK